ncbi:hypothetical protein METP2_02076 [Methanosarcinales archaeon]|nr:hypothetical protein METP2_02076 [Methanosarcinales archaeon]
MNNHYILVIKMETLIQPDLVMKRKVCENCGEGTFEFCEDVKLGTYLCQDCSVPE